MKVQELLFDEFISKLKEPKVKAIKAPKTAATKVPAKKKTEVAVVSEVAIPDKIMGEIRITESKVKKTISFKVKVNSYKKEGELPVTETKEKILKKLLAEIYDKFPESKMEIKINYKSFIKDYNSFKVKYNQLAESSTISNDIGKIKMQNELINNPEFIKIKDNIILTE